MPPPEAPWGGVATFWRRWGRRAAAVPTPDLSFSREDTPSAERPMDAARPQERVGLLVRRMQALHLDPDRFAVGEDCAFAELKRLCARCDNRGQCERELDDEFADPGWQVWRDYCPNATTLSMLTALHGCETVGVLQQTGP